MYDNLEGFDEDRALDGKLLDSYTRTDNKKSTDEMVQTKKFYHVFFDI